MVRIYSLTHPSSSRLYVGKTIKSLEERLQHHIWECNDLKKRQRKVNWIRSLKKRGLTPEIKLIAEVEDSEWQEKERYYIRLGRQLLGDDLLNSKKCPGGEGFGKGGRYSEDYVHKTYSKICPQCSKSFIDPPKRKTSIYCSTVCAGKAVAEATKIKRAQTRRKLSDEDLKVIVSKINSGELIKDLAKEYSVSRKTLSCNLNGHTTFTSKMNFKTTRTSGLSHHNVKINQEVACAIREKWLTGKFKQYELASEFGISQATVWSILKNQTWKVNN